MDKLLAAVADLRIHGDEDEEREFRQFKIDLITELEEEERRILEELARHHERSFRHAVMVARDVEYIARSIGLSEDKVQDLRIAALLHDVGKLDIHEAILDSGNLDPIVKEWEVKNRRNFPGGDPRSVLTLEEVISFKSKHSADPGRYLQSFKYWLATRGLSGYYKKPVMEYFMHHQSATRTILEKIGADARVVEYAASHHPAYFDDPARKRLPPECVIIEIADKFNAMIQSEGLRTYFTKMSRTQALDIIINELKECYGGIFQFVGRKALRALMQKYLPESVESELRPNAKAIIRHMRENIHVLKTSSEKREMDHARKMLALITATIALSDDIGRVLDRTTIGSLRQLETELKHILRVV